MKRGFNESCWEDRGRGGSDEIKASLENPEVLPIARLVIKPQCSLGLTTLPWQRGCGRAPRIRYSVLAHDSITHHTNHAAVQSDTHCRF